LFNVPFQHKYGYFRDERSGVDRLIGWSLMPPFSTNMAISDTKSQGWRAISIQ